MLTVTFAPNEHGPELTVDALEPGSLMDLCDATGAPVSFSCRAGTCGTCRVEVLEGGGHLEAPEQDERNLLEIFAAPPTQRLACQARLRQGEGRVSLRWVPEYE